MPERSDATDRAWKLLEASCAEKMQHTSQTLDTYHKVLGGFAGAPAGLRPRRVLAFALVVKNIGFYWADARKISHGDSLAALFREPYVKQADELVPGSLELARELVSAVWWIVSTPQTSSGDALAGLEALRRATASSDTAIAVCNDLGRIGLVAILLFARDHGMDAGGALALMRREIEQAT
jgi:hypothetical protein